MCLPAPAPFRNGAAVFAASLVGALSGAVGLGLSYFLMDSNAGMAALSASPFVALFSFPIWMIGAGIFGVPGRMAASGLGLNGPVALVLVGAITVGLIWSAVNDWSGDAWSSHRWLVSAGNTVAGVISGGLAGYAAWWAGRPRLEASQ